jgi:hypothetical protein
MFAIGMLVGLAVLSAAAIWYRAPNARFSSRVLDGDLRGQLNDSTRFLRNASGDVDRVLDAARTTSSDPVAERDRVLMVRRYRIGVALVAVFAAFPFGFELIGLDAPFFLREGMVGIGLLVVAVGLLVHRVVGIARPVIAYGEGRPLDRHAIVVSSLGAVAIGVVLLVILIVNRP